MVTHQLQVERRTAKGHRPKTDALPLDHTTNTFIGGWFGNICVLYFQRAACSTFQTCILNSHRVPLSNPAKTRHVLKFAGVPQTTGPVSAASGPNFAILWGHVEGILLLNKFFPIVDTCLMCEDIARQSCAMVPRWPIFGGFLRPVFSASRVQHISDLNSKFALRPHHVCKYGRHPICDR